MRYSFGQRLKESGKPWRDAKLTAHKTPRIFELEKLLSLHNSRTSSLAKFRDYLAQWFQVEEELYAHYSGKQYRIARWHNWRDRRASEDKFVQKVIDSFAAPPAAIAAAPPARLIIAYGDGSGFHALRNSPPSPTTGLQKRFLARAHQGVVVIDTPEYCSSKMCSRCGGEVVEDPTRKRKLAKSRRYKKNGKLVEFVPVWGIRRCNSAICGGHCRWNRDHNAAINIRANLLHYLETGAWPPHATGQQQPQQQDVDEATTTITAVGNL